MVLQSEAVPNRPLSQPVLWALKVDATWSVVAVLCLLIVCLYEKVNTVTGDNETSQTVKIS